MSKTDGGPAFPAAVAGRMTPEGFIPLTGMTLRDYFAAAALTGLAANPNGLQLRGEEVPLNAPNLTKAAFQVADFMLIERDK